MGLRSGPWVKTLMSHMGLGQNTVPHDHLCLIAIIIYSVYLRIYYKSIAGFIYWRYLFFQLVLCSKFILMCTGVVMLHLMHSIFLVKFKIKTLILTYHMFPCNSRRTKFILLRGCIFVEIYKELLFCSSISKLMCIFKCKL